MSFELHLAPALTAIVVWWFATGVILWIDHRTPTSSLTGLLGAAALAPVAAGLLWWSASHPTVTGVYAGFAAAILLWGVHELSFLMGWITGPSRAACPAGLAGRARLRAAWAVIAHHELALLATLALTAGLSWSAPNQTGFLIFAVLFIMRATSKLALFMGAPYAPVEFLPARMRYLATYFGARRQRWFLLVVILAASSATASIAASAFNPLAPAFSAVQLSLVAALLALGVLEHLFLAAPLHEQALWRWALPKRATPAQATPHSSKI